MKLIAAKEEAQNRHADNAQQDRATHAQIIERDDGEETDHRKNDVGIVQIAEGHQRSRIADHDTRRLERDDCQKEADTRGNRNADRMRNTFDDHLAHPEQRDDHEQATGDKHRAKRGLPGKAHAFDHRVREIRVQAHARCAGNRIVRVQAHDQ